MNCEPIISNVLREAEIAEAVLFVSRVLSRYVRATPKENAAEKLMTGILVKEWNKASGKALSAALSSLSSGSGPVTETDLDQFSGTLEKELGDGWNNGFQKKINSLLTLRYALGKSRLKNTQKRWAQRKKASVQGISVEWSQADQVAVDWLAKDQAYWVGTHYSRNMADKIAKTVKKFGLEEGLGREEVGKKLAKAVGTTFDEAVTYWQGVAATAMTRSSVFGATQAMVDAKIKRYRFISVNDERSSEICKHMDGKVFNVKVAVGIRDDLMAAKTPDEVKEISVWPTGDLLEKVLETDSSDDLASLGIAVPPLHFHCRSDIVAED